jgi:hypothetical protein
MMKVIDEMVWRGLSGWSAIYNLPSKTRRDYLGGLGGSRPSTGIVNCKRLSLDTYGVVFDIYRFISALFILVLLFISMLASVSALGITPGRSTFNYLPGEQRVVNFGVVNSGEENIKLVVLVEGELKESVELSEDAFSMSSIERERSLSYTLNMPEDLSPGLHTADVSVVSLSEQSPTGQAFIGAVVGVKTQLHVLVPYPGKFAEAKLNILDDDSGVIKFVIPVHSRGKEELEKVSATFEIYKNLGERAVTLNSDEVSISSEKRRELSAEWDVSDVEGGRYIVIATLNYDGKVMNFEREFNVGKSVLNLVGIGVKDFTLGEIAKFEMIVESEWSETIEDANAQMIIYEAGREIANLKSSSKDISPNVKTLMELFWDTADIKEGIYETSLFLRHGDSSEQRDFKIDVRDDEINIIGLGYVISSEKTKGTGGSLVTILVVVIVFLVLANLSWFLYFRKGMKRKKRK